MKYDNEQEKKSLRDGRLLEAVQQTVDVTKNLTKAQIRKWEKQGLTKVWVEGQLTKYTASLAKGADKLKNSHLIPRKELMEKILELWK